MSKPPSTTHTKNPLSIKFKEHEHSSFLVSEARSFFEIDGCLQHTQEEHFCNKAFYLAYRQLKTSPNHAF